VICFSCYFTAATLRCGLEAAGGKRLDLARESVMLLGPVAGQNGCATRKPLISVRGFVLALVVSVTHAVASGHERIHGPSITSGFSVHDQG
jgi:hypothetical protein